MEIAFRTGRHTAAAAEGPWRRWTGSMAAVVVAVLFLVVTISVTMGARSPAEGAAPTAVPAQTRVYYIAADRVLWNYAPDGKNDITGAAFDDAANTFVAAGPDRIGSQYYKSLYREYTDSSFQTLKPRPAEWEHLGFLGPVIHAQVGDKVQIVFKNNLQRPSASTCTACCTRRTRKERPTPTAPPVPRRGTTPSRPGRPGPTTTRCRTAPAPAPWRAAR